MNRFYDVITESGTWRCQPKGQIRRHDDASYRLPVIGDQVTIDLQRGLKDGVDGYLLEIKPRTNMLLRSIGDTREQQKVMAANLAQTLIVQGIERPGLDFAMLDRFLVTCELLLIPACIVFNKVDLNPDALQCPQIQTYAELGYPIIETSTKGDIGMGRLKAVLENGISLFAGTSGVGKSSLINWLVPKANLLTGPVNERRGTGRHTTTYSVLIPIKGGGYLADSPGLRDFFPPHIAADEVRFGYVEMRDLQRECKFTSCLHLEEPGCHVKEAVRSGDMASFRYHNYKAIVADMQSRERARY